MPSISPVNSAENKSTNSSTANDTKVESENASNTVNELTLTDKLNRQLLTAYLRRLNEQEQSESSSSDSDRDSSENN